jgi:hypothetical protein
MEKVRNGFNFKLVVKHSLPVLIVSWLLAVTFGLGQQQAQGATFAQPAADGCFPLVMLLDRSGSIQQTDPANYSASVVKMLSQIWYPCPVALITYPGESSGFLDSANPTQMQQLFSLADRPASGGTPMATATRTAYNLLQTAKAPAGSVVVNITDGLPDNGGGEIEKMLPQFKAAGYFINTVGLAQADGAFLTKVATQTGGTYYRADSAESFARIALGIYAKYKKISLLDLGKGRNLNLNFSVDPYARRVILVVGKDGGNGKVSLAGPGGPVQGQPGQVRTGSDRHYELLDANSLQPGSYRLQTDGAQEAAAYLLIDSALGLVSQTAPQQGMGRPVKLVAQLTRSDTGQAITEAKATDFSGQAEITLTDNTRLTVPMQAIDGGRLEGEIPADKVPAPGIVNVRISGNWKGVIRSADDSVTLFALPRLVESPANPALWTIVKDTAGTDELKIRFQSVVDDFDQATLTARTIPVELPLAQLSGFLSGPNDGSTRYPAQISDLGGGVYLATIPVAAFEENVPTGPSNWHLNLTQQGKYKELDATSDLNLTLRLNMAGAVAAPVILPTPTPSSKDPAVALPPPSFTEPKGDFPWWLLAIALVPVALWLYLLKTRWPVGRLVEPGALALLDLGEEPRVLATLEKMRPPFLSRLFKPGVLDAETLCKYGAVRPIADKVIFVARGKRVELRPVGKATPTPTRNASTDEDQIRRKPAPKKPGFVFRVVSGLAHLLPGRGRGRKTPPMKPGQAQALLGSYGVQVLRQEQDLQLPARLLEGDRILVEVDRNGETFETVFLRPAKLTRVKFGAKGRSRARGGKGR